MVGLLECSDDQVSQLILDGIQTLAQFCKSGMMLRGRRLIHIAAYFRKSIAASIPQIMDSLLEGSSLTGASLGTLAKLSEHGKYLSRLCVQC
jgi:hypothetical protein